MENRSLNSAPSPESKSLDVVQGDDSLEKQQREEEAMVDEPFPRIDFAAYDYQPGAPEEPKDMNWLGIVMTMPKRAYLAGTAPVPETEVAFTRVPVCWYQLVQLNRVPEGGVHIVVRDIESGARYQGAYSRRKPDLAIGPPPGWKPPPVTYDDNDLGSAYRYANLIEVVRLPAVPATYEVYLAYGPYESNHETLKILPWVDKVAGRPQEP